MRNHREPTYAYRAKATARNHWIPFALTGTPPEIRRRLRVWYFPGPETLETDAYRDAGFSWNQLLALEWDRERAARISAANPALPLFSGPLREFLAAKRNADPDWANLDFDGSVMTFRPDVLGVIGRIRLPAARLGISTSGSRDRASLAEALRALSFWGSAFPEFAERSVDLLRRGNRTRGLVLEEPAATYMLARELAAGWLLVEGFGGRAYGAGDADAARGFRNRLADAAQTVEARVSSRIAGRLGRALSVPTAPVHDLANLLRERRLPVRLESRLRFAYQTQANKWRWTWYYRFAAAPPTPLAELGAELLGSHPPLHVVDFTGAVIGNRSTGLCPHCLVVKEQQK